MLFQTHKLFEDANRNPFLQNVILDFVFIIQYSIAPVSSSFNNNNWMRLQNHCNGHYELFLTVRQPIRVMRSHGSYWKPDQPIKENLWKIIRLVEVITMLLHKLRIWENVAYGDVPSYLYQRNCGFYPNFSSLVCTSWTINMNRQIFRFWINDNMQDL